MPGQDDDFADMVARDDAQKAADDAARFDGDDPEANDPAPEIPQD